MNCVQWVAAERRRHRSLTACPIRHYGLPLLCGLCFARHGRRGCMLCAGAVTCLGLFSCKPHVREFRGDKSSQLLLLTKHHQASTLDNGNVRSPFQPRTWYPFLGHRGSSPTPRAGLRHLYGGSAGWKSSSPPSHHLTSQAGWTTVLCLHAGASSSAATALQCRVRTTHSCSVAVYFFQILFVQEAKCTPR